MLVWSLWLRSANPKLTSSDLLKDKASSRHRKSPSLGARLPSDMEALAWQTTCSLIVTSKIPLLNQIVQNRRDEIKATLLEWQNLTRLTSILVKVRIKLSLSRPWEISSLSAWTPRYPLHRSRLRAPSWIWPSRQWLTCKRRLTRIIVLTMILTMIRKISCITPRLSPKNQEKRGKSRWSPPTPSSSAFRPKKSVAFLQNQVIIRHFSAINSSKIYGYPRRLTKLCPQILWRMVYKIIKISRENNTVKSRTILSKLNISENKVHFRA